MWSGYTKYNSVIEYTTISVQNTTVIYSIHSQCMVWLYKIQQVIYKIQQLIYKKQQSINDVQQSIYKNLKCNSQYMKSNS